MTGTGIKSRNSIIELLRIISIVGIVGLHIYGEIKSALPFEGVIGEILFILISGYYSVSFSFRKLSKLHVALVVYSIAEVAARYFCGESVGLIDVVRALLPVVSFQYWYFSCYFLLVIFSGLINRIVDELPQKVLLSVMVIWMLVVCTFNFLPGFGFGNDGFLIMLFYYVAGRYLRKYGLRLFKKDRYYLYTGILLIVCSFVVNVAIAYAVKNAASWLANDYFILVEISAIFIFYYFTGFKKSYSAVNKLATFVPFVYMCESAVRLVLFKYLDISGNFDKPWLFFLVLLLSLGVTAIVVLIEMMRRLLFDKAENYYVGLTHKVFLKAHDRFEGIIKKYERN